MAERPRTTPVGPRLTPLDDFLLHWQAACVRRGLRELLAEVAVPEVAQSHSGLLGREFLLACALNDCDADAVLSEIALLTIDDEGEETWRLHRCSEAHATSITGSRLSAHFATTFVIATWVSHSSPMTSWAKRLRARSAFPDEAIAVPRRTRTGLPGPGDRGTAR